MDLKLIKIICLSALIIVAFFSYADIGENIRIGDDLWKKGKYHEAAIKYYAAAEQGNQYAVDQLGKYYNLIKSEKWYDWDLAKRHIQKAADACHDPKMYSKQYHHSIIIVASEEKILEKLAFPLLKRTYFPGRNNNFREAIKKIKKDFLIRTKKGKFYARAIECGKLGRVPVVDSQTFFQYFEIPDQYKNSIPDFAVFVKSFFDPDILIPFKEYHRLTYEQKMAAFLKICQLLGASSVRIDYYEDNKKTLTVNIKAEGMKDFVKMSNMTRGEYETDKTEKAGVLASYNPFFIHHVKSPWFATEPTWQVMAAGRMTKLNPMENFKADFSYEDTVNVNLETKNQLEIAGCGGGMLGGKVEYMDCKRVTMKMNVTFKSPLIIIPIKIYEVK